VLIRVHRPQPLHPVLPSPDAVLSCELVGEDAIPELARVAVAFSGPEANRGHGDRLVRSYVGRVMM